SNRSFRDHPFSSFLVPVSPHWPAPALSRRGRQSCNARSSARGRDQPSDSAFASMNIVWNTRAKFRFARASLLVPSNRGRPAAIMGTMLAKFFALSMVAFACASGAAYAQESWPRDQPRALALVRWDGALRVVTSEGVFTIDVAAASATR